MAIGGILLRCDGAAKKRVVLSGDTNGYAPEKHLQCYFRMLFLDLAYVDPHRLSPTSQSCERRESTSVFIQIRRVYFLFPRSPYGGMADVMACFRSLRLNGSEHSGIEG
jgi:hypothetical protein